MPRLWDANVPQDRAGMADLLPPVGWIWGNVPFASIDIDGRHKWNVGGISPVQEPVTRSEWAEQRIALATWAKENLMKLTPVRNAEFDDGGYAYHAFQAFPTTAVRCSESHELYLNPPVLDGVERPTWRDDDGNVLFCTFCGTPETHRRSTYMRLDGFITCGDHARPCRFPLPSGNICAERHNRLFQYCRHHDERIECVSCHEANSASTMRGREICGSCNEFRCDSCGRVDRDTVEYDEQSEQNLCAPCREEMRNAPNPRNEEFDDDGDVVRPADLKVEKHPRRPVRYCSIEMELAEGAQPVVTDLYREGLSRYDTLMGYHHGRPDLGFCYVEQDSSLGRTGGELILPFLKLDDDEVLGKLHSAVRIVRNHVKNGPTVMDLRCGLHIHVDAHKMGIGHVRNLAVLFNFLEDPLYRMSSARYMRHRGMTYANKIGKQNMDTTRSFGVHFLNQNGHEHALNVGHYWNAMRNSCRCGAVMIGQHSDCECNLGKCTFEFRIYNGTTNFRKIHAYAALSQSMVAYARGSDDLSLIDFPVFEYEQARADVTTATKERWDDRLVWMFQNLYFSQAERQSLLYVLKNCQLNELGEDRLVEVASLPYIGSTLEHEAPENTQAARNEIRPDEMAMPRFFSEDEADYDEDDPF